MRNAPDPYLRVSYFFKARTLKPLLVTSTPLSYTRLAIQLLLFASLVLFLMPVIGHQWDMFCWKVWSMQMHGSGLSKAYSSTGTNYPPLFLYMMYLFGQILGSPEAIDKNIHYIKLIPFFFDLLPVFVLILMRKKFELRNGYHWLLLLNIAYLYNSIVWGQVDSIHSSLVLVSLLLVFRYPLAATLLFVLALNMKLQAIIFIPVLLLSLLSSVRTVRKLAAILFSSALLQFLILLPFIIAGELNRYWSVITGSMGFFNDISLNAFNFWHLVLNYNPIDTNDEDIFFMFSFRSWGLLLFCTFSAIALWPMLLLSIRSVLCKNFQKRHIQLLFLSSGLVTLLFFFFNTQMHERYSHPAVILLFFYCMQQRRFGLYFLVSVAYLLNLDAVLEFTGLYPHVLLRNPEFIAAIFLAVITWSFYDLYSKFYNRNDLAEIRNLWAAKKIRNISSREIIQ